MKVYGIKNCDTVKKTLNWLTENNISYEFHDYKKSGISLEKLNEWASKVNYEVLINKKGTTWKKLSPDVQNQVINEESAFQLMMEKTSVIKRPIIEDKELGVLIIGFDVTALNSLKK